MTSVKGPRTQALRSHAWMLDRMGNLPLFSWKRVHHAHCQVADVDVTTRP